MVAELVVAQDHVEGSNRRVYFVAFAVVAKLEDTLSLTRSKAPELDWPWTSLVGLGYDGQA